MLSVAQIGLNTADLPGSLQFYSDAFGFANAGAQTLWGQWARVQGTDDTARSIIWWLVGRQKRFQLELFYHTRPKQRPLRADWKPNDLGWVRFGVAVADFDRALEAFKWHDVPLAGDIIKVDGLRRAAVRDPFVGAMLEVMEDGPAFKPRQGAPAGKGPAFVYATSSVSDLDGARSFYRDDLGAEIVPLEGLHVPAHEALWGLPGAAREGFLARFGDVHLEILRYTNPKGRPKPADYRFSDQGITNVAFGPRRRADSQAVLDRLMAKGLKTPYLVDAGDLLAFYIIDPEREIELATVTEDLEEPLGFVPKAPFFGAKD